MRRLYSTFAGGWPGVGLLLMRVVVGYALVARASLIFWSDPPLTTTAIATLLLASGVLLIVGLWTPIVGTLVAFIQLGQIATPAGDRSVPMLLATIAGALAMLGPGLWSVDARLFGWKRVEASPRKSSLKSS